MAVREGHILMAKPKTAKEPETPSLVVTFEGKPALEIRWLSDVVFDRVRERVEDWLSLAAEIERDDLNDLATACVKSGCTAAEIDQAIADYVTRLESCSLHAQSAAQGHEHIRSHIQNAFEDLLRLLVDEAYSYIACDLEAKCLFPQHRQLHRNENEISRSELEALCVSQLRARLNLWRGDRRGGKLRIVKGEQNMVAKLAKEYENLTTEKTFGDERDRALWEVVCQRYENDDPKWRERARLDKEDIPESVLDLVVQRRKFKLKRSHLALYHAASRAGINFNVSTHSRTGKPFLTPSPSTLLRRCLEGAATLHSKAKRSKKRKRTTAKRAALTV